MRSFRQFRLPWLFIASVWMMIGTASYWWFLDPVAVHLDPVPVMVDDDGVLAPGESLSIRRTYCVDRDVTLIAHRTVVDHFVYNLPSVGPIHQRKGCQTNLFRIDLPPLPAGDYIYRVDIEVQSNLLRTDWLRSRDIHFKVRP